MSDVLLDTADAVQAMRPPTWTDPSGRVHVGRVLSIVERAAYAEQFRVWWQGSKADAEWIAWARAFVNDVFPPPPRWRRILFRADSVWGWMLRMSHERAFLLALSFLKAQAVAHGVGRTMPGERGVAATPPLGTANQMASEPRESRCPACRCRTSSPVSDASTAGATPS